MKLNESKYKAQIGEYFDYSMDWDFLDIVANVLERIDFEEIKESVDDNLREEITNAINDELIYTEDQWTIMHFYQTPNEANFENAWFDFEEDIYGLVNKIKGA